MKEPVLGPLRRAIEFAGGQGPIAYACGLSQATVSIWLTKKGGKVPGQYVDKVSKACGGKVTPEELRPDLYGKEPR